MKFSGDALHSRAMTKVRLGIIGMGNIGLPALDVVVLAAGHPPAACHLRLARIRKVDDLIGAPSDIRQPGGDVRVPESGHPLTRRRHDHTIRPGPGVPVTDRSAHREDVPGLVELR